ncbi:heparan-alpha-glucosaminide N-acetyltransferase [Thermococcus camini]|uniref:Heparan-alpha-glucosaminide N-acetyltransferase catalytic domain-containing protein n=1 Tax=Thermococcus camini TaxID=2016373 RepID=A0A7G2D808_9EURY|nr:heparan-alpha-glucosaminide N-acetyltransferase [Thermococcus camini]CAD5244144.1 conserved membrane protein of unknown function [Thermococcus camini]
MLGAEVYLKGRYWEVDLLRGIGIMMMVVSNFVTDLWLFLNYSGHRTFWFSFAIATASIFVFTSGLSFRISYSRAVKRNPQPYRKYFRRFLKLFGLGMLITLVTSILPGEMTIHFGILHFLGVATLLAVPFYRFGRKNVFWAFFFLFGHLLVRNLHDGLWLLPLGITPENYFAPDYFPIFPWFGVHLLGMAAGSVFYPGGTRKMHLSLPQSPAIHFITFAGRHTLAIYLLHQPVLVGLLRLIHGPISGLPI